MASEQLVDTELSVFKSKASGLKLRSLSLINSDNIILCDIPTGKPRPLVPQQFKRQVFDLIHGLSHPSIRTTKKLLNDKFVWNGINKDASDWARCCFPCQQSNVNRHVKATPIHIDCPARRFDHIHVDLVGPLPLSKGCTHLLTIIDRFTRWPEAIPISDTSTPQIAKVLIANWIARFGMPIDITSDRSPQFTSQLWSSFAELLGTKLHHTTAYHPQANGLVEHFHRQLKTSLKARLNSPNSMDELPWVLLGIRTAPK